MLVLRGARHLARRGPARVAGLNIEPRNENDSVNVR